MSFLNPVNEPVLRFSSTDVGAPQINYNARAVGDVKAVLKACLVTGYGTTASAGWSAVNEAGNVIEFVSPSAAMSDYRLGIDDTSTSSTTWYYRYQDVRTDPSSNKPVKSIDNIDKLHVSNGWRMFITERGMFFIEVFQHDFAKKLSTRVTYFSRVKSALVNDFGENIAFFNIGHRSQITNAQLYTNLVHIKLADQSSPLLTDAINYTPSSYNRGVAVADIVSRVFIKNTSILGQLPGFCTKIINKDLDMYGIADTSIDGKSFVQVTLGYSYYTDGYVYGYARHFLIDADYWEY